MGQSVYFNDEFLYAHHTLDLVPDPDEFFMHTHDRMEILLFIRGKAQFTVEGSVYPLFPGDIIINRSSESHRVLVSKEEPYERISIHFSPSVIGCLASGEELSSLLLAPFLRRSLGQGNRFASSDFRDASYETYIRKALSGEDDEQLSRFCLISNLMGFLSELRHAWLSRTEVPPETLIDPVVAQIISYINEHLFEDLSLSAIASQFFLSQAYIGKRFVQATGTSVWSYVMIKRLHYARAAIRNGKNPQTVYLECGYRDYSAFYRAYRKLFGCSPVDDKPCRK